MKRSITMGLTIVLAMGAATTQVNPRAAVAASGRPNVLVIVTDDQRAGLKVMPQTRHYLIQGGVKFPRAYDTTPLCCPSRASIITGRFAHNHGVITNSGKGIDLLDQESTVQYYLQNAGYRTALYGKYFNGWSLSRAPPYFNDFAVSHTGAYKHRFWDVNGTVQRVNEYNTNFIGDRAVRFIKQSSATTDPWFMYVSTAAPHSPFTPQDKYATARVGRWDGNPAVFEKDRSDKPPYVQAQESTLSEGRALRRAQYRTLLSVDDMVKRIFGELGEVGQRHNTLVFFISDNGLMWGEHGLAGGKGVPYSPSVNVPMLARWPGRIPAGSVDPRLVANIDIAPTIMAATGAPPDPAKPMDGRDLLDRSWRRTRMLLEYWCSNKGCNRWASTTTDHLQYTEYYDESGLITFRELYENDPWQLDNVLADGDPSNDPSARRLHRLHRRLANDRNCVGSGCP